MFNTAGNGQIMKLQEANTLFEELDLFGDVRDGSAVLTKDATGYHMRDSRNLFNRFRHDLSLESSEERVEAHWDGFVSNVRRHYGMSPR